MTFLPTQLRWPVTVALMVVIQWATLHGAEPARGSRGMVATGHPLATQAGLQMMQRGGNAVDAAVAAALMLGVVDGYNSGLGGGCFLLLRLPGGEIIALDGRETAPATATRGMYLHEGKADTSLSQVGALASATPGALAAYALAVQRYGKRPLREHLILAAEVAEKGFTIDATYAARLKNQAPHLKIFASSRQIFLRPDGEPWAAGHRLQQPDLATTYRQIAEHGVDWFYRGPFAQTTSDWMKTHGGLLSLEDFNQYQPRLREPVRAIYRRHEVVSFPPPSSGGVHLLQMLNILEHFDLRKHGAGSTDTVHLVTEAMKLAFADRAHWMGDPDFTPVPRGLISKEYARTLAEKIDLKTATDVPHHHTPADAESDVFGKHTTHLSTADAEGYWVACTATINTTFGSKVVIPGTGVVMNNEMDDFSIQPGVPNAFGLIGGDANAVAASKRPLSSMSPTIVLHQGRPILAVGAAGGPTIISQTLLAIINTVDFGMNVADALRAPRFHHQWRPGQLRIERSMENSVHTSLGERGHQLDLVTSLGACQAVAHDPDSSSGFTGAADPRNRGTAAGF